MGNCLSTPDVNEGLHKHTSVPQGQYKAGKNAHDSVHSLDTAGSRDAAAHGTWSSKQPQAQQSFKQQQKSQHSQGVTGMGTGLSTAGSSASNSSKQRKPPGVDLATGKPIPDFNVNGVLDVLHELGSGGSGTTYLCRDLKTAKVCVHGGRATLGALGKRGGGACLAVLTMSGGMMRTFALGTVGRGARALGGGGKEILQAADNVGWGGGVRARMWMVVLVPGGRRCVMECWWLVWG